jgi:hypothetical protein
MSVNKCIFIALFVAVTNLLSPQDHHFVTVRVVTTHCIELRHHEVVPTMTNGTIHSQIDKPDLSYRSVLKWMSSPVKKKITISQRIETKKCPMIVQVPRCIGGRSMRPFKLNSLDQALITDMHGEMGECDIHYMVDTRVPKLDGKRAEAVVLTICEID